MMVMVHELLTGVMSRLWSALTCMSVVHESILIPLMWFVVDKMCLMDVG